MSFCHGSCSPPVLNDSTWRSEYSVPWTVVVPAFPCPNTGRAILPLAVCYHGCEESWSPMAHLHCSVLNARVLWRCFLIFLDSIRLRTAVIKPFMESPPIPRHPAELTSCHTATHRAFGPLYTSPTLAYERLS